MIKIELHKKFISSSNSFELNVSFTVNKGEFVSLFGESGAGKTSVLRMIAGLDSPNKGSVVVSGDCWFDSQSKVNQKPQKRKIGMVFQDYALFPNMTVRQNLEYALEKKQSKSIIDELIEIIELQDIQNRKTDRLSGGQKQRVALARALVKKPSILLLDEPLSALDDKMRNKLQEYILKIHKKYNLTTFLVSHDISEVIKLSDKVVELKDGKITRQGSPDDLFLDKKISGKYNVTGTILSFQKADIIFIASVIVGNNLVKVIVTEDEKEKLQIGDKVLITAKAFNPIILKI